MNILNEDQLLAVCHRIASNLGEHDYEVGFQITNAKALAINLQLSRLGLAHCSVKRVGQNQVKVTVNEPKRGFVLTGRPPFNLGDSERDLRWRTRK